jgi:UPF0755 protein
MLQALRISILFFVFSSVAAIGLVRADDVSGIIYATGLKIEKLSATTNMAALYTAATTPHMAHVSIPEGYRKEQIAETYATKLGWSKDETERFAEIYMCTNDPIEGYLYPGVYAVPKGAKPEDVKLEMKRRFTEVISEARLATGKVAPFDLDTVITVASMIQREAAGKKDMKIISGIMWNRLFKDMSLDIDATLQYVKGNEDNWWPQVKSEDKYLDSPYNTYQNKGLPPGAIANPGLAAIAAAANPDKTSCIFYLHDKYGRIHCSQTYAGHKQNINWYLK